MDPWAGRVLCLRARGTQGLVFALRSCKTVGHGAGLHGFSWPSAYLHTSSLASTLPRRLPSINLRHADCESRLPSAAGTWRSGVFSIRDTRDPYHVLGSPPRSRRRLEIPRNLQQGKQAARPPNSGGPPPRTQPPHLPERAPDPIITPQPPRNPAKHSTAPIATPTPTEHSEPTGLFFFPASPRAPPSLSAKRGPVCSAPPPLPLGSSEFLNLSRLATYTAAVRHQPHQAIS